MNKFYLITNKAKDSTMETTCRIKEYIEKRGRECVLWTDGETMPRDVDCVLILGGDGTLIRAAREMCAYRVPLLGINMGRLGYLTETEVGDFEESLNFLMENDDIRVEERMMLKGTINDCIEDVALNDIVFARSGALRIIQFKVYVNGELLNTYHADGVIVSTPTGSTGYNLSAGGPIVEPTASMIVITPICSHALNTSSIVLSAEDEVMIEVGKGRGNQTETASVSFDGEHNVEVHTGDKIVIRKSEDTTKLVKLSSVSFLEILRKKMKGN